MGTEWKEMMDAATCMHACNMHADADAGTYYYVQAIVESESKVRLAHTYVVVLMLPLLQHKE